MAKGCARGSPPASDTIFVHEHLFPGMTRHHPGPGFRWCRAIYPVSRSFPRSSFGWWARSALVLACAADHGGHGFRGVCPQGSGLGVVGESDLAGPQVADDVRLGDRARDVDSTLGAAPPARRRVPCWSGEHAGRPRAGECGPRGCRGSSAGPGPAWRRWNARAGSGRRAGCSPSRTPAAARRCRSAAAPPAGTDGQQQCRCRVRRGCPGR